MNSIIAGTLRGVDRAALLEPDAAGTMHDRQLDAGAGIAPLAPAQAIEQPGSPVNAAPIFGRRAVLVQLAAIRRPRDHIRACARRQLEGKPVEHRASYRILRQAFGDDGSARPLEILHDADLETRARIAAGDLHRDSACQPERCARLEADRALESRVGIHQHERRRRRPGSEPCRDIAQRHAAVHRDARGEGQTARAEAALLPRLGRVAGEQRETGHDQRGSRTQPPRHTAYAVLSRSGARALLPARFPHGTSRAAARGLTATSMAPELPPAGTTITRGA
jgi:hypothetical protein